MKGKTVKQVLQDAGPMWVDYQVCSAVAQSINNKGKHAMDVSRSSDGSTTSFSGAATGGAFAEGAIRLPPVFPPVPAGDVAAQVLLTWALLLPQLQHLSQFQWTMEVIPPPPSAFLCQHRVALTLLPVLLVSG
ncbi:uncharacterized protein EDB91DRAFT_1248134 [Suillus paluster]|uniref:uncharacterized protein n=1 Tax=Suillus paluster TaxID=48578 RepID=UPI001B87402C|nr:uncharacterized protein EDB91DRAFT_1248134 [Suillus paluster]KAG1740739.1 hypothetical protein EDB91DRAFT_1248134 [Suillus paluster]